MIYADGNRWVIEDAGSPQSTTVNGQPLTQAAYLESGDVITLGQGEGAPAIEVDPFGILRRTGPARPANPDAPDLPQPPLEETAAPAAEMEVHLETPDDLPEPWAIAPRRLARRRKKPQSNLVSLGIAVTAMITVVGGMLILQFLQRRGAETPPAEPSQPTLPPPNDKRGKSIFDFPKDEKKAPTPPAAALPLDPAKQTDEWKLVEEARSLATNPATAIWVFADYRMQHPGQFEKELEQYEEAAIDQAWWERIKSLCEKRDALQAEVDAKLREIGEETNAEFKTKLEKEKQSFLDRRRAIVELLQDDMGYRAKPIPNTSDESQIARLRQERDAGKYEGWKKRVVKSIQSTRKLPWESNR
jgi:hypothetical protein